MAQFPFIGPSHSTRVKRLDAQETINLYPEVGGLASKNVVSLIGTPGLRLWTTLAGGAVRGLLRFSATQLIAVVGANIYSVNNLGVGTLIGAADSRNSRVSMASNGSVVMLVTGGSGSPGYIVDPVAGSTVQILDADFQGADRVGFLDGRFVFNRSGTSQFQWMELYSTDLSGLSIASAEGAPDKLVSLIVDHRELWLPGETSTEVFYNTGDPNAPFQRIDGAFIENGCAAPDTVAKMNNTTLWLAADERGQGQVVRAQGYTAQPVSDHAVAHAIAGYSRIDDAFAYTYQQEQHHFYVLTFPTAEATWVYDDTSEMWHQRNWRDPVNYTLRRHRSNCHAQFNGMPVVGDFENGNLYYFDLDHYTDNGALIRRLRAAPHLSNKDYKWQVYDQLILDMTVGVGLSSGQGVDPQIILQWSTDGGYTWGNEHFTSIGRIGETRARAEWRRLGRSRDRIFRVIVTDPVRVEFVGASVTVRNGVT